MGDSERISRYLIDDFRYPIRDPLWSHIYLSSGLRAIVAGRSFQKLRGIKQLGPTYLVYPGATHTRFSHSLGVLEIAKRTLQSLLRNADLGFVTLEGVKAFLAAALLHDLGHFPYAHSLKELALKEHERLTGETILTTELSKIIADDLGADPALVSAIVDLSMHYPPNDELTLYRRILSGVLDPDKLDYLNRDAFFCGVSYGTQDIDFVLSKLRYDTSAGMMLGIDGLTAVENVLFSKYLMYRTVYWHRTVRAATSMIKKSVHTAMRDGAIADRNLYGIDDEDFARAFSPDDHATFDLIRRVSRGELHTLILELPVDSDRVPESARSSLESRTHLEREIIGYLERETSRPIAEGAVIVDVPEPISFEAELMIDVGDAVVPFPESGTVFDRAVVEGFSHTLRKLRLFVDPAIAPSVRDPYSLLRHAADAG